MFIAVSYGGRWTCLAELLSASALGLTIPCLWKFFDFETCKAGNLLAQMSMERVHMLSPSENIPNTSQVKAVGVLNYHRCTFVLLGLVIMKMPLLLTWNQGSRGFPFLRIGNTKVETLRIVVE